jgi:predicted phosphodiesterase
VHVAALYDIHGNVPALDAVLSEIGDDVAIVVGGDVAAGPWPRETMARLFALGDRVHWVRGNADRELAEPPGSGKAPAAVMEWMQARASAEDVAFLVGLPTTVSIDGVLYCHATPRDDEEILTRISPDERWREVLEGVEEGTVVCGHTHIQFDRVVDGIRIVNAGSVGMPYEDEPGAYWLLVGADVERRRTEYDVDAFMRSLAEVGFPDEWPSATPDEATEFFEKLSRGET